MDGDREQSGANPYTGRWRHKGRLVFRVWPKFKQTHRAIVKRAEIPIDGFVIDKDGHTDAVHYTCRTKAHHFELADEDVATIAAAKAAGARLLVDQMVVRCPGTTDVKAVKQCWLEVPFIAYPTAPFRARNSYIDNSAPSLRNLFGADLKATVDEAGYKYEKLLTIESVEELDEDMICREVVENGALVVIVGMAVSGGRMKEIMTRAKFWVAPGKRPDEDGGLFRGYQFFDRFVRWQPRLGAEDYKERMDEWLNRAHETVREKGRVSRRVFLTDGAVNRFAERVGMSRQRVASRFLDDGVIDWLVRSADAVQPIKFRETKLLMRGRVSDAVDAIEFYYRAIEGGLNKEDNQ